MHGDRLNFYSQRELELKMTTQYRFQISINKENTQVLNGSLFVSLLTSVHILALVLACVCIFLQHFGTEKKYITYDISSVILVCKMQILE